MYAYVGLEQQRHFVWGGITSDVVEGGKDGNSRRGDEAFQERGAVQRFRYRL